MAHCARPLVQLALEWTRPSERSGVWASPGGCEVRCLSGLRAIPDGVCSMASACLLRDQGAAHTRFASNVTCKVGAQTHTRDKSKLYSCSVAIELDSWIARTVVFGAYYYLRQYRYRYHGTKRCN